MPLAYPHALRANDPVPPVDTEAPVISNFSPIVKMKCNDTSAPYTEDVAISIRATDYDQANVVCKWDTSVDADPTYAELSNTFTVSGETFSDTVTANCAAITSIYYACTDGTNTTSVTSTNIEVGDYGDTSEAVITNVGMTNQACAVTQLLIVNTDKQSTCKWSTTDQAYASMENTFTTTVDTTHHEVSVTQNCSTSTTRYVRCSTVQGVANSSSLSITTVTDAAKTIGIGTGSLTIGIGTGTLSVTILP